MASPFSKKNHKIDSKIKYFHSKRDFQESFGNIATLFNDKYGQHRVKVSKAHKSYYDNYHYNQKQLKNSKDSSVREMILDVSESLSEADDCNPQTASFTVEELSLKASSSKGDGEVASEACFEFEESSLKASFSKDGSEVSKQARLEVGILTPEESAQGVLGLVSKGALCDIEDEAFSMPIAEVYDSASEVVRQAPPSFVGKARGPRYQDRNLAAINIAMGHYRLQDYGEVSKAFFPVVDNLMLSGMLTGVYNVQDPKIRSKLLSFYQEKIEQKESDIEQNKNIEIQDLFIDFDLSCYEAFMDHVDNGSSAETIYYDICRMSRDPDLHANLLRLMNKQIKAAHQKEEVKIA
jgi:hypothetical protein